MVDNFSSNGNLKLSILAGQPNIITLKWLYEII